MRLRWKATMRKCFLLFLNRGVYFDEEDSVFKKNKIQFRMVPWKEAVPSFLDFVETQMTGLNWINICMWVNLSKWEKRRFYLFLPSKWISWWKAKLSEKCVGKSNFFYPSEHYFVFEKKDQNDFRVILQIDKNIFPYQMWNPSHYLKCGIPR